MRRALLMGFCVLFSLACAKVVPRQEPTALAAGAALYQTHCAACHGATGRGDGPSALRLGVRPPDLTTLSRRNGGRYPSDEVLRLIGGRVPIRGHGGPEMPIWGDAFLDARDGYDPRNARRKITLVTDYLGSLQTTEER